MRWLVLLAPVLLCTAAAAFGYGAMARRRDRVRERRVPLALVILTAAVAPLTWVLLQLAPREPDFNNGGTCPAVDDGLWGLLFLCLYLGSAVVGGLALAASLAASPTLAKPAGVLLVALGVPYAIGFTVLLAALCGLN